MKLIKPDNFHEPVGHYSPAVVSNGFVFVSGQLAVDPETGEATGGTIEEQTEQCLRNLEHVLIASESGLSHLVKVTIFVSDESLWGPVNETYRRVLGDHRPARAIIPVSDFRRPFLIEVEAIAEIKV
ncbi:MAG: RidA family protein [Acidobacteria bacterium]|nr:MAG: RidA family protein [Acidobacteriota bacterium]REJ98868.1 MAG: RidA family protein [Acidobacteriota bacterium]REK16412.1 MAG: RidA family protein [Acidobacteriota bacterium]REK44093.1 MAG: RidA family protein [Acidobacteriota bacterium]